MSDRDGPPGKSNSDQLHGARVVSIALIDPAIAMDEAAFALVTGSELRFTPTHALVIERAPKDE